MSDTFDPYLQWLGIRDDRRPPHHYRLLGLEEFESDEDVIANAADRQMAHVRTFQAGKYSADSQRILNELSAAKLCLLHPQKKAQYDAALQAELQAQETVPEAVMLTPAAAAPPAPAEPAFGAAPLIVTDDRTQRGGGSMMLVFGALLVVGVMGIGLAAAWFLSSSPEPIAEVPEPEPIEPAEITVPKVEPKEVPDPPEPKTPGTEPKQTDPEPKQTPEADPKDPPTPEGPPEGQLASLKAHEGPALSVALAPNGALAVSGGADQRLRVWDLRTGEPAGELEGHTTRITKIRFSDDGTRLISFGENQTIRLWDLILRKELNVLAMHRKTRSVDWSLDANRYLVGYRGGGLWMYDLQTEEPLAKLVADENPIDLVALSRSAARAVSSSGSTIKLWNMETSTAIHQLDVDGQRVTSLAISPNGKTLAYGTAENGAHWIDFESGERIATLDHEAALSAVQFSVGSQRLLTAATDGSLKLWHADEPSEPVRSFMLPNSHALALTFATDGLSAMSAASDGRLRLWELPEPPASETAPQEDETIGLVREFTGHDDAIRAVAFSPDGKRCATGSADNSIHVFDTDSGELIQELTGHDASISALSFASSDQLLSGSDDGALLLWTLGDAAQPARLSSTSSVMAVGIDPDSGKAATADSQRGLQFWELASSTSLGRITAGARFDRWDFDSQLQTGVSAGYDRTLRVWNLKLGTAVHSFKVPGDAVSAVALSDDSTRAATGDLNGMIRVWDLPEKREALRLSGVKGPVWSLQFAPEGKQLLAGGHDHQVHLYDLESGRSAIVFQGHTAPVTCTAYTTDGKLVLSGDRAGVARLWRLPLPEPMPVDPDAFVDGQSKPPEPAKSEVAEFVELLRTEHKAEYGTRQTAEQRAAFTGRLLAEADVTDDALARFALLSEARDVAISNADIAQALQATRRLANGFEIDAGDAMSATLTSLLRFARSPLASLALVRTAINESRKLAAQDEYVAALRLTSIASRAARSGKSPPLSAYATFQERQLRQLKTEFDRLKADVGKLKEDPGAMEANTKVGKFHCFWRKDFSRGLPMLALGDDDTLAALARDDLAMPTEADTLFEVGRRWLASSKDQTKTSLRTAYEVRAYDSFRRALKNAEGLSSERIKLRLTDVGKLLAPKVGRYLSSMPESEVVVGHGTFGKAGRLGYAAPNGQQRIIVRGQHSPNGISMYPPGAGASHVAYGLFGEFVTFRAGAAIADTSTVPEILGLTFKVIGDGKVLWQSVLTERSQLATCTVSVRGVEKLELVVECADDDNSGSQAVWLEPSLWPIELE